MNPEEGADLASRPITLLSGLAALETRTVIWLNYIQLPESLLSRLIVEVCIQGAKIAMAIDAKPIVDLVLAYKILVNEAVLDSFGHISVRSIDNPERFLLPRAMPPSLVETEDVLEFSVETSQPVDPRGWRVNGERYLHGEIYKVRPDVKAIVHSHSQAVIPFSLTSIALHPVIVQAGFMPLRIPNFEIRDVRGNGRGMQITDKERGAALAKTLGGSPLALLRGHGNVVVGSSIKQAVVFAAYTDINARMQAQALQIDRNIVMMDQPELFEPREFDINRPWENFRQKLISDTTRARIDRAQFGLDHTQ
jgi:HCOMODA/2-hydroxy-3-carboxy-muconic semialdehyde decarboxylase